MSRKYTIDDVRRTVSEISDCELLSTEYTGVYDKLRFRCSCGREFEKSWDHFRYDKVKACQQCARRIAAEKRRLSVEEVRAKLRSIGCELLSDDYQNNRAKIRILCKCGHEKTMALNTAMTNNFSGECDACTYRRVHGANRLTRNEVANAALALGVGFVSDEYIDAKTPAMFRCRCGRVYKASWTAVKTGGQTLCDRCSGFQSEGSTKIEDWLDRHGMQYEKEKTFAGCLSRRGNRLRFDFYLPDQNVCIEYDGQHHFKMVAFGGRKGIAKAQKLWEDVQENDAVKDRWCATTGKKLLRIGYEEFDNIDNILVDMLIPR